MRLNYQFLLLLIELSEIHSTITLRIVVIIKPSEKVPLVIENLHATPFSRISPARTPKDDISNAELYFAYLFCLLINQAPMEFYDKMRSTKI